MKNVIILDKSEVNAHYDYWDTYRYSITQLKLQAIAHYLSESKDRIYFKEFKKTYHVWIEGE